DGPRAAPPHNLEVKQRLGRRIPDSAVNRAGLIDVEDVGWLERALVDRAGRDRQAERVARGDDAEVPARAKDPAARVEPSAGRDEALRGLGVDHVRGGNWGQSRISSFPRPRGNDEIRL